MKPTQAPGRLQRPTSYEATPNIFFALRALGRSVVGVITNLIRSSEISPLAPNPDAFRLPLDHGHLARCDESPMQVLPWQWELVWRATHTEPKSCDVGSNSCLLARVVRPCLLRLDGYLILISISRDHSYIDLALALWQQCYCYQDDLHHDFAKQVGPCLEREYDHQ